MDDDIQEGENARLSTTVKVPCAEHDRAIAERAGFELGISIVHVGLVDGVALSQRAKDVQLDHVTGLRGFEPTAREHDAHGWRVVVGDVVGIVKAGIALVGQVDERTAGRNAINDREGR